MKKNALSPIITIALILGVLFLAGVPAFAAPADPYEGIDVAFYNGTGNFCIEGYSGTNTIGGNIDLWSWWSGSYYYAWRIVPDANQEYFQIRRQTSASAPMGNALAPTGGAVTANTVLTLAAPSSTSDNQWWRLNRQTNGRFIIVNKADESLCIAPEGSVASGTKLILAPLTASNNTWRIGDISSTSAPTTAPLEKPIALTAVLQGISVPVGTAASALELPDTITVTYANETVGNLAVSWNTEAYNGSIGGIYTLVGTLQLSGLATNPNNVAASIEVTVEEDTPSGTAPKINDIRIINNNMIELWWDTPTATPETSQYYRFSDNHPDTLTGAGSSLNFHSSQNTDRNNFEIKLDGAVIAQRTGTFSPYYWHAVNYNLHQVRMNQHITTLRLSSNLTTAQMAALENGTSTITVQVVGDVTNRAGEAADKTKVLTARWKPYYDKVVTAKTGFQIKGSEFVDIRTLQKAADITDVIMSSLPEAVVASINATGAFLVFGPGEHSGNIPEQRNVITYDQFNRAEGYGGTNAATSAANVERCNVTKADGTVSRIDYYPATYRTGYQHESILAHEFGHKIHSAFNAVYSSSHPLRQEFLAAFANVTSKKMWTDYVRGTSGGGEYFATMTSVWHNAMSEGNASYCNTREEFYEFDRKGYEFFAKLYGQENTVLSPDWDSCPNTGAPRPGTGTGTSALGWDGEPFESPLTRDILSAAPQISIKVPVGTALEDIILPATVRVNYTDSNMTFDEEGNPVYATAHKCYGTDTHPVLWDTSSYKADVDGTYTFAGTIQPFTRVLTNTGNAMASITVVVGEGEQETNLQLTTEAKDVKAGDEFTLTTSFKEPVNSNAAVLTFTFATDKFEYVDFTPAAGVSVVIAAATDTGAQVTVMVQDYNTTIYGDLTLRAKADGILADEENEVKVLAEYVVKPAEGDKFVAKEKASTIFNTIIIDDPDPVLEYNLLTLSDMIDVFGRTSEDPDWKKIKIYDLTEDGQINIDDVALFASRIGKE